MKVGLCLGAGGVVGASWLIGALEALEEETGWDPTGASAIVGTSAGSVIGALCAEGLPGRYMAASITGAPVEAVARESARAREVAARVWGRDDGDPPTGIGYHLKWGLPSIGPGSWSLGLETLRHPLRHSPTAMFAGWLPRGFFSTDPIRRLIEAYIPGRWPDHPSYWAVAADYADGRRVPFGREGAPEARIADAVAASCAIPAFYHPVHIGDRRYIDGGVCSMSNLDLLADRGLDLVIVLNPLSSAAQVTGGSAGDRVGALMRSLGHRRLDHEMAKVRSTGTEVVVIEPSPEAIKVMGLNMMSSSRRVEVLEAARATVRGTVRELARDGHTLPGRVRRVRRVA